MNSKCVTIMTVFAVMASISINSTNALKYTDCAAGKNTDAKLLNVEVANCKGDRCDFIIGTNASIEIDYEATSSFGAAELDIHGIIAGMQVPFPINPNNACGNYGFNCPVKVGDKNKFKLSMPVLRLYPRIPLTVRFAMLNERKGLIFCIQFPVKIRA